MRVVGGAALVLALAMGGCDIAEQAQPALPTVSLSTTREGRAEQVVVMSEPHTMVQVVSAREDGDVRIYPPSAKQTDARGEAAFTIHSDHSVDVVATARNRDGETHEELHLEIHTVPSIRIDPTNDELMTRVACESKELVAEGFRSGTLCASGRVSFRDRDRNLVFDVTVLGDELSVLRIGGQTIDTRGKAVRVELPWLTSIGATRLRDPFVGVPVELDLPNGARVAAPLALSWAGMLPEIGAAVRERGLRFDGDEGTGDEPTLLLTDPVQIHGPGTTLADVDYLALAERHARVVERCRQSGGKLVERRTTDATVTVYERRTGRKIASTTIRGAKPDRCSDSAFTGGGDRYGGWKSDEVQAWVADLYDSKLAR